MRIAALLCTTMLVAGCGSAASGSADAAYKPDATKACLEKSAGVLVTPTPASQLGQFPGATDALTVNWSLSKQTPPAAALILFAASVESRDAMENALDSFAREQVHVRLKGYLDHDRNAAWAWIAPHGPTEDQALRGCLQQSI